MFEVNSAISTERKLVKPLVVLFTLLVLSGYFSLSGSGLRILEQWAYLLHTLGGVLCSVVFAAYIIVHFRRTIGLRRSWTAFAGILSALMFLVLAGSGLQIAAEGQTEAKAWLLSTHIWVASAVVLLIALHIVFHVVWLPERRKKSEPNRFPSLAGGLLTTLWQAAGGGILAVLLAGGLYQMHALPFQDHAVIQPYGQSYGPHPFRPSQTETISGGFYDVKRVGNSEQCATCHQEIAEQWRASIHAQAASDKTYQTNINLLAERRGMDATRYCEGCHAPVALLSGQLSKGGKLDTPGHFQQGVSCMACHGIERVEHLKGVASYRFSPPTPYLFEGATQGLPLLIHNFLLRLKPEQHKADLARNVLSTPEMCATCHAQFMDEDFNHWGWVKMQDDYTAWLNGPYSGQTRQTFAHAQQRRCQDCHFPLQPGKDPSASELGLIKTHFNVGANTAIPWVTQNQDQLERTRRFLRADQMRISIDRPNRTDATESARHIDQKLVPSTEAPAYVYLGETVSLKVAVTNAQVGHAFPGGTTDLNEAWIEFLVQDGQGRTIYHSGYLDADNQVDESAYFYKSVPIDRQGQAVWRHDLFNMVGDSFKRVIPPGGTDVSNFSFTVPDDAKGTLVITASLNYRKLNQRYAKWALKDEQIKLPVVEMASSSLLLPVQIKPEVVSVP